MILDTSGIDRAQLIRFVNDRYALEIGTVAFLPKGEASYGYIATEGSGAQWLIKVQATARMVELEIRLRAVRFVWAELGFTQVIAPLPNRLGDCSCHYEQYTVTVYPFVEGDTIEPGRQTDAYVRGCASLLGAFHACGASLPFPIPRATFDHRFEGPIVQALRTVEAPGKLANPTQERLRELMLTERSNLVITLKKMRQLTAAVRQLELDWALIHGDPNWANILVDRSGSLRLLDWDDLELGPPEHDLVFFSNRSPEHFEAFLHQYLDARGSTRLHAEMFAYYQYHWILQEIADYATRILFRNVDPAEDEHAWTELQPYLPVHHADIASGVRQIEATLARIARG